ncbi:ATPase [Agrobacterium tumefaciens str. Cherry 2E-2-2]|nr:ATPase [Agrobacterium tumefaciens str. Cherry 2E-2-2]
MPPLPPITAYEVDRHSAPTNASSKDVVPLTFRAVSDFASKTVPVREFFVDELIPAKTVTIIGGDGGTGKSLLTLQLGVAATTSGYWCGRAVSGGRTLFLSAEDDEDELHRRLHDITRGLGISLSALDDLHIHSLVGEDAVLALADSKSNKMIPTKLFHMLDATISRVKPSLLVLDTLADMFGGDEINRAQVRQFIGLLRGFCARYDVTIVLLAHPSLSGMANGSGSSGSTAWNNSVRSRLYLDRVRDGAEEPDPDLRVLRTKKANYGKIGGEIKLRWVNGMFKPEATPDSLVVIAAQNTAERVFLELLAVFAGQGRRVSDSPGSNFAPKQFSKEPNNSSITSKGFEAAMLRLFAAGKIRVDMEGPPSKQRKSIVAVPTI